MKSATKNKCNMGAVNSVFRTPFSEVPRGYIDVYRAKDLPIVEPVNMNIVSRCNKTKIGMLFKSMEQAFFKREHKHIKLVIM
jgi:hypothetical protein